MASARPISQSMRGKGASPASPLAWALWMGLSVASLVPRLGPVWRGGFSPDEELTVLAARGISANGVPRLPSGVISSRGLGFSYVAWTTGRVFGQTLPSYRLPSLLAGSAIVLLTGLLAARLGASALLAGLLACTATLLVVVSSWARFYAPFVACFLATSMVLLGDGVGKGRDWWFLLGAAATRLFHELGVTLWGLPLFFYLQSPPRSAERERCRSLLLRTGLLLVAIQLAMASLPGGAGQAPDAVLDTQAGAPRLLPLLLDGPPWSVALVLAGSLVTGALLHLLRAPVALSVAGAVCAATLNLGLLSVIVVGFLLVSTVPAWLVLTAGVTSGLASLALWSMHIVASTDAGLSLDLVSSLARAALSFPLTAAVYLAKTWPVTVLAAALGLLAGFRTQGIRAMAFLTLGCLVLLGVVTLEPKPRYFLAILPLLFCLAAVVPAVLPRLLPPGAPRRAAQAGLALVLFVALLWDHEVGVRDSVILEQQASSTFSRLKTAPYEQWSAVLEALPEDDKVICNDDMGCLLAGRRPDYWWLGSASQAVRYGMQGGKGQASVYTGAPIITDLQEPGLLGRARESRTWVVLLDSTKYGFLELLRSAGPDARVSMQLVREAEGIRLFRLCASSPPGAEVVRKEVQTCLPG